MRNSRQPQNAFLVIMVAILSHELTQATLTLKPMDTVSMVGEPTFLSCSTDLVSKEIHWKHEQKYVYAGGSLVEPYLDRFHVDKNQSTGVSNLVIPAVETRDAGEYSCVDEGGTGDSAVAQLLVLESNPKCISDINTRGVIGPNSCGIKPEEIQLSCGISYHGNAPPTVQWKNAKYNRSISANFTSDISGGQVTYNATVTAEYDFDGTSFICQIEKMQKHFCRTDVIRVLYAFNSTEVCEKNVADKVICSANTSNGLVCRYQWRWFENKDSLTVSNTESLKIERPGMHRCQATCDLRGNQCMFVASQLFASLASTTTQTTTTTEMELSKTEDDDGTEKQEKPKVNWCRKVNQGIRQILNLNSQRDKSLLSKPKDVDETEKQEQPKVQGLRMEIQGSQLRNRKKKKGNSLPEDTTIEIDLDLREKFNQHRKFLEDNIDPDFGLLDKLRLTGTLTQREIRYIQFQDPFYRRNILILDYIVEHNKFNNLLDALREADQVHLVNYFNSNGEYKAEDFGDEWPLGEEESSTLEKKQEALIDPIKLGELVRRLHTRGVINNRQKEKISSEKTSHKKNDALLNILRRRSLKDFKATIQCLRESKQDQIAQYGGADLKLRAVFDFDPEVMSEQQEIELKKILESKAIDLEDKGDARLIYKDDTSNELLDPYKMALTFKKGDLMETMPATNIGDTITWWRAKHLESGKIGYVPRNFVVIDYQTDFDQKNETSPATSQPKYLKSATSNTSISNLPLELLDSILQKSYLQCVLWEEQVLKNKDYHAISQMASVDCCWFQRIRRRKFKKELRQRLIVYYRRKEKLSSIYRINRQYLEENIQLQGLFNQLKSIDCLTDVQAASLYRQNLPLGKKNSFKRFKDLTSEVVKRTEAIHSVFRRCLSDTKQHPIAEVIENGGAMTKVEIKLQKAKTSIKTRLLIAERINEMREKMKIPRSHQIVELMSKQKEDDVEIFNVGQDGDVIIVWIWCKTKHDLEKLQTLNKSKHIIDVLTEVVKNLSSSSEEPMIIRKVNTDFQQFKKRVVFFSIVANFTSRLKTEDESTKKDEEYVVGVTKLRNKIHIILNRSSSVPRCVILVFEDEIPFRLQKRIEIEEIEFPLDITSIEMENSLYVLDLGRRECVWKIKEEGDEEEEKEEIIRWLELRDYYSVQPKTLSVTRDGQLLLVGRRKNDPWWSLRIFGGSEKGDLRLSISLPEDIQWPYHAVETSKGNFIISHEIMRKKEKERGSAGGTRQMEKEMEEEKKEELFVVSKVSGDGETIIRRFIPQNEEQKLNSFDSHLAVDSFGRVFLTDRWNARVILFDSDLQWNGILIPTKEDGKEGRRIRRPWRLFYDEEKKELIVGGREEVFIYTLNRK